MEQPENRLSPYTTWSTRQVISWLRGLDDLIEPYLSEFEAKGVTGKWLSSVTPDELLKLGVFKVGHQMIIMDRIRQLQTQYASFDNENMQLVLFRVSRSCICIVSAVSALMSVTERQDCRDPDSDSVYPGILDEIRDATSYILSCVLTLTSVIMNAAFWLERPPFSAFSELSSFRQVMVESALMTNRHAQLAITTKDRNHFKEMLTYVESLRTRVEEVVHNFNDSVMYTPCSMELVQIRKVDRREFGFNFCSKQNNVHVIVSIQNQSPAFRSGKLGKGDEVIEVNDQVVIGWQHRRVVNLMRLDPKRITMRLRKRPTHGTDFTGFPGGGRRHRLLVPQNPTAGVLSQQTRSNFLLARTPRRRTPLTSQLVSEPLSATHETPDHQVITTSTSVSTLDASACSPSSSSSSSSQCPSMKLNDLLQAIPDRLSEKSDCSSYSFPAVRMISSTPSTPLMVARNKVEPEKEGFSDIGMSSTDSRDGSSLGDTSNFAAYAEACVQQKASEPSPVIHNTLPRFGLTHRRAASGGQISLPGSLVKESVEQAELTSVDPPVRMALSSGRCQALDNRSRNRLFVGSLEDIGRLGKLVFGTKRTARRISCEDLGNGCCQGWLWLKKSNAFSSKYVKRWCVFRQSTLYYYRNPEDSCAEGLIIMHGFTITPASVTKSSRFPFYVVNELVRFVFASESEADQAKWVSILSRSSELHQPRISGFGIGHSSTDTQQLNLGRPGKDDTVPLESNTPSPICPKRSLSPHPRSCDKRLTTGLSGSWSMSHGQLQQANQVWSGLKQTPPSPPVVKSPVATALPNSNPGCASSFRPDGWSSGGLETHQPPQATPGLGPSGIEHYQDNRECITNTEEPAAQSDRESVQIPRGSPSSPVVPPPRPMSASPQPNSKLKMHSCSPSGKQPFLATPVVDRRRRSRSPASDANTNAHSLRSHYEVFAHRNVDNH